MTTDNTIHLSPPPPSHEERPGRTPTNPARTPGEVMVVCSGSHSGCERCNTPTAGLWQALGLLVPVNSTPHRASISGLSTQSSTGSLTHAKVVGDLILERASRLDAFSGYPFRT